MPVIYCIVRNRILRTGITFLEAVGQLKSDLFRNNQLFKTFVSLLLLSASISAHAAWSVAKSPPEQGIFSKRGIQRPFSNKAKMYR